MKTLKYGLLLISVLFFFACEKETEGISRITEYANFEMQGEDFIFVLANSTFKDPGVTASEGETVLPVDIKGTVNTSVPGVYNLEYSAKNSDGFAASVQRSVAVVAALPTKDLSGKYKLVSATRNLFITITKNKGMVGYYHTTDSWWQQKPIALDFVDLGNGTLVILSGSSAYGGHNGKGNILADNQIQFINTLTNQGNLVVNTTYKLQ